MGGAQRRKATCGGSAPTARTRAAYFSSSPLRWSMICGRGAGGRTRAVRIGGERPCVRAKRRATEREGRRGTGVGAPAELA